MICKLVFSSLVIARGEMLASNAMRASCRQPSWAENESGLIVSVRRNESYVRAHSRAASIEMVKSANGALPETTNVDVGDES